MFRGVVLLAAVAALSAPAHAFAPPGMLTSSRGTRFQLSMGYVPDGMSPEQWKKMQAKEKSKSKGKNLGATGDTRLCLEESDVNIEPWEKRVEDWKPWKLWKLGNTAWFLSSRETPTLISATQSTCFLPWTQFP
eukprot:scaffold1097_cov246-Pinguiococcus_pyrenoidosus.AAC.12